MVNFTQTKIIINADDLGFSPSVNSAILHCAEQGTVTAASVMVNMPFAEEALSQIQQRTPPLSLALHFTLTSGKPVSPPQDVPLLVDTDGLFRLGFLGLWQTLASKKRPALLAQIQTELSAQLRLMDQLTEKYQCCFNHLDSHQHIHALPGIWELLQREATQRHLPLRVPREQWGTLHRCSHRYWSWFPQGLLKQAILHRCLHHVPQTIGYFGILETGRMDSSALLKIFQSVGKNSTFDLYEINTHPSALAEDHEGTVCCSEADKKFHLSFWREKEFQALKSNNILSWAQQYNIILTGFPIACNHPHANEGEKHVHERRDVREGEGSLGESPK